MDDNQTSSKYLEFLNLVESGVFDPTNLEEAAEFKTYNEYAEYQVNKFPEILMAFMQYDTGEDSMFYIQLVWMHDYFKGKKKQAV